MRRQIATSFSLHIEEFLDGADGVVRPDGDYAAAFGACTRSYIPEVHKGSFVVELIQCNLASSNTRHPIVTQKGKYCTWN
jgi:hypothetical protein